MTFRLILAHTNRIEMKIFGILITMFFIVQVYGGHSDISTELKRLNEIKKLEDPTARDTQQIWQYNFIAEQLARNLDPRTDAYLDTLRTLSDLSSWDMAFGFYLRAKGRYYDFQGSMTEALSYYDLAINAFEPAKGDLKEIAFTFVLKGFLLSNSELYQECKTVLNRGIPYARKAQSKNSLCLMLDWFGDYYFYGLADTVNNEKALQYYLQVNELLPSITYAPIIADNHAVLSGVYARLDQNEKADYHFSIADSICLEHNLLHVRWGMYAEMAQNLENKNEYLEANKLYVEAHDFMQGTTNIIFKSRVEKALWQNYKSIGNHEKALEHYESFMDMEAVMAKDEVEKNYAEVEAKYQLSVREKELVDARTQRLTTIRNFILIMLLITIISTITIFRKNNQLKKSFDQLEESQAETKQAIYKGETQERQRLAAELHDNVNTKLAAAKWQLEAISDKASEPSKEIIENTIAVLTDADQDVRNISHNLVPARLEIDGLVPTIENLFEKLNETQKVELILVTDHLNRKKIAHIVYPLYNIVLELINNILKHSQATRAQVEMSNSNELFYLSVNDNGVGYNAQEEPTGFGIKSISNRIKSLKGSVAIKSGENEGTRINILIPL